MTLDDFDDGQRIELSPALDAWAMGDRFGEVVKVGRRKVHVLMDRSRTVRLIAPQYIGEIL